MAKKHETLTPEAPTMPETRTVTIDVADNGYVVKVYESGPTYKEAKLVFTSQASMLKAVKEATTMKQTEEEE